MGRRVLRLYLRKDQPRVAHVPSERECNKQGLASGRYSSARLIAVERMRAGVCVEAVGAKGDGTTHESGIAVANWRSSGGDGETERSAPGFACVRRGDTRSQSHRWRLRDSVTGSGRWDARAWLCLCRHTIAIAELECCIVGEEVTQKAQRAGRALGTLYWY